LTTSSDSKTIFFYLAEQLEFSAILPSGNDLIYLTAVIPGAFSWSITASKMHLGFLALTCAQVSQQKSFIPYPATDMLEGQQ